jgi:N-methylhydantoinase A/oxoprolinase/acetone carboxylase beta subunit
LRAPNPGRLDGRFAQRTGVPEHLATGLTLPEARLYETIAAVPQPLDRLLTSTAQVATLNRLVARGLVHVAGFTPSDAAHVLNRQSNWNRDAAELGARLFARRKDGRGQPVAPDAGTISERVLVALTRRSAEVILETAFAEDGLDGPAVVAHPLVQRALNGGSCIAGVSLGVDRPVIGLGASAPLHYVGLPDLLNQRCVVPEDTDVANALGAVVGQVRVSVEIRVSQPVEGLFRVAAGEQQIDFPREDLAMDRADVLAKEAVVQKAGDAGAQEPQITVDHDIRAATVEGQRSFIEAIVTATAAGRPRVAS